MVLYWYCVGHSLSDISQLWSSRMAIFPEPSGPGVMYKTDNNREKERAITSLVVPKVEATAQRVGKNGLKYKKPLMQSRAFLKNKTSLNSLPSRFSFFSHVRSLSFTLLFHLSLCMSQIFCISPSFPCGVLDAPYCKVFCPKYLAVCPISVWPPSEVYSHCPRFCPPPHYTFFCPCFRI